MAKKIEKALVFKLPKIIKPYVTNNQTMCSFTVEHFKPVAKIVCYNYLILFIAEFNSLNVLYTGKSLFSITTLSISAYND